MAATAITKTRENGRWTMDDGRFDGPKSKVQSPKSHIPPTFEFRLLGGSNGIGRSREREQVHERAKHTSPHAKRATRFEQSEWEAEVQSAFEPRQTFQRSNVPMLQRFRNGDKRSFAAPALRSNRRVLVIKHPGWLVATALGVVAFAAFSLATLVSPVLAGRAERRADFRFQISDLGMNKSEIRDPKSEIGSTTIDASTPSQDAVPATEPPPALQPSSSSTYDVVTPPSLSVAQIESVLKQYGSPAVGKGQAMYDLGVRYGIDPAYALAFFVHESGCATQGVARFSRSIGNIRWTAGYKDYEGYRAYDTWEQGIEDWYKLISDLYIQGWGLRTVDAITPVYAPWGDNNHPPTYIAAVKRMVDNWRGK